MQSSSVQPLSRNSANSARIPSFVSRAAAESSAGRKGSSFRAEQAAPASQRRGGEGVEPPCPVSVCVWPRQQFRRTGDQGFKQFFSGHCALPWFRLIHISCGGKSVLQRHKGTAQHPRLPLLEL